MQNKLELFRAFVKEMKHTGVVFVYLHQTFPWRSGAKLKAGIFVGSKI